MAKPKDKPTKKATPPDFHGAALIDESGREIPITETMVQNAISNLNQKVPPTTKRKSRPKP